jgi:hypothetical protein
MLHRAMAYRASLAVPLIALVASTGCSSGSDGGAPVDGGTGEGGTVTVGHELTLLASLGGPAYTLRIDSTSAYALLTDTGTRSC